MAFTVPNRPDGVEQDQAEPDKGDFQTLGYQRSGVLTGGATTRTAANTVTVAALTGYLNGEYFSVSSDTVLNITAPPSGSAKFVLILVQKSGSTFSVYAHQGTAANNGQSASNAMFPDDADVDYTAKMLLAAVYYASGDTDISASSIVDKRVFVLPQANPMVVATAPVAAEGNIGEIRIDSSITPANGQSIVWIKTAAAIWTNLGKYALNSDGDDGDAATITIGTVTTGAAGTQAAITNRGTSASAILDFTIPRGADGDDGSGGGDYSFNVTRGYLAPQTTVTSGDVLTLYGGAGIDVTNEGSTFTFAATGTASTFSFDVGASAFDQPFSTIDGSSTNRTLLIYGGDGIDVTRQGTYFTIAASGTASTYSFNVTRGYLAPQTTITSGDVLTLYGGAGIDVTNEGSTFTFAATGTASTYSFDVGASAFDQPFSTIDGSANNRTLLIYGGEGIDVTRQGSYFTIAATAVASPFTFDVGASAFDQPFSTIDGSDTNRTLLIYGGDGIDVTRQGSYFTISSTAVASTYSFDVGASAFDQPFSTIDGSANNRTLLIYGGTGIDVTRQGTYFTVALSDDQPGAYSYNISAGGLNSPHTVNSGGEVKLIGGSEMQVTQSGGTFTINYVGTTSSEYISSTTQTDQNILSTLNTEHLYPHTGNSYHVGHPYRRYSTGWFDGAVYAGSHVVSSDRSLKQSFGASPGLGFINALGPLSFEFKDAPGKVRWGLVAQDVEDVCTTQGIPAVVSHDEPKTGNKYLNYMDFTAPIIKAIQELSARVEVLENG